MQEVVTKTTNEVTEFFKNQITKSKRERNLEAHLKDLKFEMALKALYLVKEEMSFEKGFKRHDGSPYYTHLYDVTLYLYNSGYNSSEYEDLLTASLLHDYYEDVEGVTLKLIEKMFNKNVADIVDLVSKKKDVDYKVDLEEKQKYLSNILLNRFACLLKISDRICNFTTMADSSAKHRLNQLNETKNYFIPLIKVARETHKLDANYYYQALVVLRPMLIEIENNLKGQAELQLEVEKNKLLEEKIEQLTAQLEQEKTK